MDNKLVVDDLSLDELGMLYTALKTMIIKMNELEVPQDIIDLAIPLYKKVEIIFDRKSDERVAFFQLAEQSLDDVAIASEIITANPDISIPEYK
jgi:hypothetical protein